MTAKKKRGQSRSRVWTDNNGQPVRWPLEQWADLMDQVWADDEEHPRVWVGTIRTQTGNALWFRWDRETQHVTPISFEAAAELLKRRFSQT